MHGICGGLRHARSLQVDLNFPRATHFSGVGNQIAGLGAQRIVAVSLSPEHHDVDVLKEISAAFLELRRAGRFHGINCFLPFHLGKGKFIGTRLDRRRHGRRRFLSGLPRQPYVSRIHPGHNRGKQSRRRQRPPRISPRFAIPHPLEGLEDLHVEYRGRVGSEQQMYGIGDNERHSCTPGIASSLRCNLSAKVNSRLESYVVPSPGILPDLDFVGTIWRVSVQFMRLQRP